VERQENRVIPELRTIVFSGPVRSHIPMKSLILSLLIVAVARDAPIEERYPEATEIFRCTFGPSCDGNYDQWPDQWTRRRGRGFPHYVGIRLEDETNPHGEGQLLSELDGGGAVAYSPPIPVSPLFSCVLDTYVTTKDLKFDHVFLSLTFLDQKRQALEVLESQRLTATDGWRKIRLGPVCPASDEARWVVVGLHLEPIEPGRREDLRGTAAFTDVWLGRLPRMTLTSGSKTNLFLQSDPIEIKCNTSGFQEERPLAQFELEDALGKRLAQRQQYLKTEAVRDPSSGKQREDLGRLGHASWKLPIFGPGFYRVRATIQGVHSMVYQRELTLAVIEPMACNVGSEFGWSLPNGAQPLPLSGLAPILVQSGVRWVKYPVWFSGANAEAQLQSFLGFQDRLATQGIDVVGLLWEPPPEIRSHFANVQNLSPAEGFAGSSEVWAPSLDTILARLQLRYCQLGRDTDTSFVGYPCLLDRVDQIRTALSALGRDMQLSIGWNWLSQLPPPQRGKSPWEVVSLSAEPQLTHQELAVYLDATAPSKFQRWVVLEPLPKHRYPVEVRATDLIRRILVAKMHRAEGIFVPDPFSNDRGLMHSDGSLGELFLPWRTAALLLGGAGYLGSMQLPGGSVNHVFARSDDAVMVLWNKRPTDEITYLGDNVRQFDLWGRSLTVTRQEEGQVVTAGPLPTFVTGLQEPAARWNMAVVLERERIPSICGQPHENSICLKNSFAQNVSGRMEFVLPETWVVTPRQLAFRLGRGEESRQSFQITLPPDATGGYHVVRLDFEIQADRPYRFNVYRRIHVGLDDIFIETCTQLNQRGELEVEQRFVNDSDEKVSFRCQLFAPNRQRQKTDVLNQANGQDVRVYQLPDGEELIGRTLWIRAEEINGLRVLNYRFTAER